MKVSCVPPAILALLSLFVIAGCGGPPRELTQKSKVITWPALQALQDPAIAQGIFLTAQMGDLAACKKNAAAPQLQELVDKFEAEAIPASITSPAREAAKKEVVTNYKLVISAAKGVASAKELKDNVALLSKSLGKLTDPNLE